jgi:hypothetical protein
MAAERTPSLVQAEDENGREISRRCDHRVYFTIGQPAATNAL